MTGRHAKGHHNSPDQETSYVFLVDCLTCAHYPTGTSYLHASAYRLVAMASWQSQWGRSRSIRKHLQTVTPSRIDKIL